MIKLPVLPTVDDIKYLEKRIQTEPDVKERIGEIYAEFKAEIEAIKPLIKRLRIYYIKRVIKL